MITPPATTEMSSPCQEDAQSVFGSLPGPVHAHVPNDGAGLSSTDPLALSPKTANLAPLIASEWQNEIHREFDSLQRWLRREFDEIENALALLSAMVARIESNLNQLIASTRRLKLRGSVKGLEEEAGHY